MGGRVVWKYDMPDGRKLEPFSIGLPEGAELVFLGYQDSAMRLWFEVDPAEPDMPVVFIVVGTGDAIPNGWGHVRSWESGPMVWHLYRRP